MERSIRYSKKREAILAAIQGTSCHPSAEWIYQQLKPSHPDLSLGTVYRNLIFFQERGDIRSVGVIQGQERFDAVVTPHSLLICESCGATIDLPHLTLDCKMDHAVSQQYGLMVYRHELTLHGLCPDCIKQKKSKEETRS